jgi:hypothetical protein
VRREHEAEGDGREVDEPEERGIAARTQLPHADLGLADEVGAVAGEHVVQVVQRDRSLTRG